MTFSLHSASISGILEPSPQGLISSCKYLQCVLLLDRLVNMVQCATCTTELLLAATVCVEMDPSFGQFPMYVGVGRGHSGGF